jgi:hypothetical protein
MSSNIGFKDLVSEIIKWKDKINKLLAIDLNSYSTPLDKHTKENIGVLLSNKITNTKEKGDLLESVIKSLFSTLDFAISFDITHKETDFGQFDFIVDFIIYEVMKEEFTFINLDILQSGVNGECKNHKDGVGKELIEQVCWRVCKTKKSLFYIAPKYKEGAIREISFFNSHHIGNFNNICCQEKNNLAIIPFDFNFLRVCTLDEIRFSTIFFFAIKQASEGRINNMLNLKSI